MIAPVAAKHLEGGMIRQSWQFAQLLHHGAAFFANALGGVIRRIESVVGVVRHHEPRRFHSIGFVHIESNEEWAKLYDE
jgi:hypothetical protein